jgi:hypothetical protein
MFQTFSGRPKLASVGRVKTSHLSQMRSCYAPFSSLLASRVCRLKTRRTCSPDHSRLRQRRCRLLRAKLRRRRPSDRRRRQQRMLWMGGRYPTVRRFVHRLKAQTPELVRRTEVLPGAEAQVDFGTGAWIVDSDGKRRRPRVLRIVLSHSRKAYSEAVYRKTTNDQCEALLDWENRCMKLQRSDRIIRRKPIFRSHAGFNAPLTLP